MLEVTGYLKLH